ncbi:SDR family oxidoreductase [Candidatus Woesearchaeota archaeon]|nr:SDR family oxidoreductase [Candidatus Woesearchaeota archaeon]
MRIIVTGGAGFIGSHLCEALAKEGHTIICLDNLGSGKIDNIKHLMKFSTFRFIKHNVIEPLQLIEGKIDQIYHLASRASPKDYQEYPVETALANSVGTDRLAKLALAKNSKLLFTSTSEAYGEPREHPQKESYWGNVNPVGIRSCYDESKRFGEALLMAYHREYNVDIKIVRIFNTYGPRMRKDDGRVIPNFIQQSLSNKPITIYGDGKQTRSFCYVEDLVEGLIKMMNSKEIGPKNLGNPNETTVIELAKLIRGLTKSKSGFLFRPLPLDDPTRRQPDISKARALLGWEPKVKLEDGLKKTIQWFKKNGAK